MVASDPQVPGPGLSRPVPKNVAITRAQVGAGTRVALLPVARSGVTGLTLFVIGVSRFGSWIKVLVGVFEWGRDHILAARPLSQIDSAATFTAEREDGR